MVVEEQLLMQLILRLEVPVVLVVAAVVEQNQVILPDFPFLLLLVLIIPVVEVVEDTIQEDNLEVLGLLW
jgi:hypothetical protein